MTAILHIVSAHEFYFSQAFQGMAVSLKVIHDQRTFPPSPSPPKLLLEDVSTNILFLYLIDLQTYINELSRNASFVIILVDIISYSYLITKPLSNHNF